MKLGIDIGSVSAKVVAFDNDNSIKARYYRRTHGQPVETLLDILKELSSTLDSCDFSVVSATGSGGKFVAEVLDIPFINEITAQAVGTGRDYPDIRCIIEIGGEDAKLIHLGQNPLKVIDFATSMACAAGTGSFIDQQASRIGVKIEEFGKTALKSAHPPRIAGRCSVFAKTDMIHLQQIGTPVEDIAAGLCFALARNFQGNVIKGSHLETPIAFQGGVATNEGMVRAFREILNLNDKEFIIPDDFALRGAIGAIYESSRVQEFKSLRINELINKLENHLKTRKVNVKTLEKLEGDNYTINIQTTPIPDKSKKTEGYLGVDVGSISTNVVVVDKDNNVLSRRYLLTAGKPIEAVRQGLLEVYNDLGDAVEIKAAGTTGSGRYMTGTFLGADVVKNEITSHAKGAVAMDPKIDTIFEIGGQDAKYISLSNGAIVDFTMNKVCAAGTGSFLEEQAEKLAVKLDQEFGARALASQAPLDLGERCTVFMESQLNYYKQQGMLKDDLLAGLAYSVVINYINRVVEKRKIGDRIFFQGGVAFNRSVKAAFEKITGKKVIVPPHHDILGAVGVAILAREEHHGKVSAFKGFDLSNRKYDSSSFECKKCPNKCEIRKVVFDSGSPLFYGSRCGMYDDADIKHKKAGNKLVKLFKEREERLIANYDDPKSEILNKKSAIGRVGIPRTAMFYDLAPLWINFFKELGVEVVLSDPTNRTIIQNGVENVLSEPCYPIKTAHGHIMNLLDKGIDYLFLPVQVTMLPLAKGFSRAYNCPYVQALPFTVESSIELTRNRTKVLKPVFHMDRGEKDILKTFKGIAKGIGVRNNSAVRNAVKKALRKQAEFNDWTVKRGKEILNGLKPDEKAVVIIGRPYNTMDSGLTLDLPERLRELNILAIPIDFLPLEDVADEIAKDYPYMYWKSGQRILSAARLIARDKRLFAVYITNFGCGPDSYIIKFFEREMSSADGKGKPFLALEIDEHSSDVGVMTRCEAFLDTIRNSNTLAEAKTLRIPDFVPSEENHRTIYIPYMGDHAFSIAASIRSQGISAEALPLSDEESLFVGRKFTSGKECYPSIITTGDIVKKTAGVDFNPDRSAFFMPAAQGPCRFGQYNKMHRMILDSLNLHDVPIMMFDQLEGYHKDIDALGKSKFKRIVWRGIILVDLMQKLACQIRPYEVNKGETNKVYGDVLNELVKTIEAQGNLELLGKNIRKRFDNIKIYRDIKKPKIGIIGEIYVRSNPFANDFTVRKLEELGAEVFLPPLEEWLDYIDYCRKENYKIAGNYKHVAIQKITEFVQERDAGKIRKHFKDGIKYFAEEDPMEKVIECGSCYINRAVRGESILSLARATEYAHKGFQGVVNIIPFGCMPGIVVSSLLKQFRDNHPDIPTYTIVVDGSKDPGSDMRLEAFVQQCRENIG